VARIALGVAAGESIVGIRLLGSSQKRGLALSAIKIQKRGKLRIEIALNVLGDWSLCVSFCEQ
jgi:hypothetical protein